MTVADFKVLVAEDNADLAELWNLLFLRAGLTATFCGSGREALDVVKGGFHPDILMTDYFLPDMTGLELIEAVRARCPARYLLVTGKSDLTRVPDGVEILIKPVGADVLTQKIFSLAPA